MRGRGEPYVISHSVAETAGSRGTGRKSNSCSAVQHGYSWTTTSGRTGQPVRDPVHLSTPPLSPLFSIRHAFLQCVCVEKFRALTCSYVMEVIGEHVYMHCRNSGTVNTCMQQISHQICPQLYSQPYFRSVSCLFNQY